MTGGANDALCHLLNPYHLYTLKLPHLIVAETIGALHGIFIDQRYADKCVEFVLKKRRKWGSRDRRLFAEAVYEITRWWRWFWHLAGLPDEDHCQRERIREEHLWEVWAAYWVQAGRELPRFDELHGIRAEAIQQRAAATAEILPAIRAAVPDWLDARLSAELGTDWPAIRDTLNRPADVFLRVNTLKTDRRTLKTRLSQEGFPTEIDDAIPTVLRMAQRHNVFALPAFKEGLFEVQDASSQRIAPFLQVEPGHKVVDACAGAGGKTLHLAALMQNKGKILALDIHEWKLKELRKRAARAGADVIETRPIENAKTLKRLASQADRLLLDVPCSGLGVLRRNPDSKWKLSTEEIERLILLQQELLQRYSSMVKPGGKMVYATCSILPAENEKQVQAFLATQNGRWTLEEELRINPATTGHDGFYAARLGLSPDSPPSLALPENPANA